MNLNSIKTKPKILIGISVPLVLLLVLGTIAITSIGKIVSTVERVNHTYDVLATADSIVASAVDMETGMRGYLLAGKEDFLDPYKGGEKATYTNIKSLQKTVSDNPKQVARLGEVEKVLQEWQSEVTEAAIQLRHEIGDADTMNDMAVLVGQAKGKAYFDKFRSQIATFIEREETLLHKREANFAQLLNFANVESKIAKNTIERVTHTYKVIAHANDIIAAAVDMETGMRGFLLAGKSDFLDPYKSGSSKFFELTESLRATVSDNPAQVTLLNEVDQTIQAWQKNVTEPMISLRRKIGSSKTMDDMADLVGQAKGKVYFDKFRSLMGEFSSEERGLMEVRKQANHDTEQTTDLLLVGGVIVAIILGSGIGWMTGNGIANPITKMTEAMGTLASGDTSTEIQGSERGDEIGDMASAVMVFKDNMIKADKLAEEQRAEQEYKQKRAQTIDQLLNMFNKESSESLSVMSSAANQMASSSHDMSNVAKNTLDQAGTASAATERTSANVQSVATATEELSVSANEINRQISQSTEIGDQAVDMAKETNEMIMGLSDSVTQIGNVLKLITDVADQTNLLALNATIEAARAGDAGKGFAVVAGEVKNLASQTGKATDEISNQVNLIQEKTSNAVQAIQNISGIIQRISEVSSSIAAAMEEQEAATAEITRSVQEASSGTQEVATNVEYVNGGAAKTEDSAKEVSKAAEEVSRQTNDLQKNVSTFLENIKIA